ncbi:hypothetical protein LAUMK41_03952 [Mycobacterium attenuatum]|nr:hypothetical protein LAUMK41_03952 [Mycobacterium attenuatum]
MHLRRRGHPDSRSHFTPTKAGPAAARYVRAVIFNARAAALVATALSGITITDVTNTASHITEKQRARRSPPGRTA